MQFFCTWHCMQVFPVPGPKCLYRCYPVHPKVSDAVKLPQQTVRTISTIHFPVTYVTTQWFKFLAGLIREIPYGQADIFNFHCTLQCLWNYFMKKYYLLQALIVWCTMFQSGPSIAISSGKLHNYNYKCAISIRLFDGHCPSFLNLADRRVLRSMFATHVGFPDSIKLWWQICLTYGTDIWVLQNI